MKTRDHGLYAVALAIFVVAARRVPVRIFLAAAEAELGDRPSQPGKLERVQVTAIPAGERVIDRLGEDMERVLR